jgi:hypothetical protein
MPSLVSPDTEEPIISGELGLKRRRGVETRFFLLFSERLEYWGSEEETSTRPEPRGRVNIEDIKSIAIHDEGGGEDHGCILLQMDNVSLDLICLSSSDPGQWRDALSKVCRPEIFSKGESPTSAGGVIIEGILSVERKGQDVPRYFVLMNDVLDYYEDEESKEREDDPRGSIMLKDITKFTVVQEKLAFFIEAAGEKRPSVLKAPDVNSFNEWMDNWHDLLAEHLGDDYVQGDTAQQASVVCEGPMGIYKKNILEQRYSVLFEHCFEYYNSESDFQDGSVQPRCRIPLTEFIGYEANQNMFHLQLADRTMIFKVEPSDFRKWAAGWNTVGFVPSRGAQPPGSPTGPPSQRNIQTPPRGRASVFGGTFVQVGEIGLVRKNKTEHLALAATATDVQVFNDMEGVYSSSQHPRMRVLGCDIRAVKPFDKGFLIELNNAQEIEFQCGSQDEVDEWVATVKATVKNKPKSSPGPAPPSPHQANDLLMEGPCLIALGGGKPQREHVRLYQDCFEYAVDQSAIEKPSETTTQPLRGVQSVDPLSNNPGFVIKLEVGGTIEMRVTTKEKERWQRAWQQFIGNKPPQTPKAKIVPAVPPSPKIQVKSPSKTSKVALGTGVIYEGCVGITNMKKGGIDQKYMVVENSTTVPGRIMLRLFANPDDASSAEFEVPLTDVKSFSVTDDGMVIDTPQRKLNLKVHEGPVTISAWEHAFRNCFRNPSSSNGLTPRTPRAAGQLPSTSQLVTENNWLKGMTDGVASGFAMSTDSKPKWSNAPLQDSRLQSWLENLKSRDPPLQYGLLGVQPQGQLVTGFFVLFKDRLDFWNAPVDASSGLRPNGRFYLADVRSVEMVNSGLILNHKGRKMGLCTSTNQELHKWCNALLASLAPSSSSPGGEIAVATPPDEPTGGMRQVPSQGGNLLRQSQAVGIRQTQTGGIRQSQAGGIRQSQAGGIRQSQAGGLRQSQAVGIRQSQAATSDSERLSSRQTQLSISYGAQQSTNGLTRSRSLPPKVFGLTQDVIDKVRDQLIKMIPPGKDKFAVFKSWNSDVISSAELTKMIFKVNGSKAGILGKTDIKDVLQALADGGADSVKVKKLMDFMDLGAVSTKDPSVNAPRTPRGTSIPRVASVRTSKYQSEVAGTADSSLRNSIHRERAFGGFALITNHEDLNKRIQDKPFSLNTHDTPRRNGGWDWQNKEHTDKISVLKHGCDKKSVVDRQFPSREESFGAEKIVGDRHITPRMSPGNLDAGWSKIVHTSQEVHADPARSRTTLPRGNPEEKPFKIGKEDIKRQEQRSHLTEKVTDPGRRPLADSDYKKAMADRMADKVNEHGRLGPGWASPFKESQSDRSRTIGHKLGTTCDPPAGHAPL